jgi:hypothetical protein
LAELPTLKEFEEIRRMAFAESEPAEQVEAAAPAEPKTIEVAVEPQNVAAEAAPAETEALAGTEEVVPGEPETISVVEEPVLVEAEVTAEAEPVLAADVVSESPDGGEEQPPVPPASEA